MLVCVARLRGDKSPVAVPCPASRCARLRDLKGMRGWLAAARLRLYPHSAAAAAPAGRARSGGSPLPRAGRRCAPGCSPLRLRGCCAPLRPRSPLRSAAPPLRLPPAAPWVAALPVRSFAVALASGGRARAAAPPSLRSVARVAAALPARPPRGSVPASAPAGGLRGRSASRCAPVRRPLVWRSAPPRFAAAAAAGLRPLRRAGFRRCGARRKPTLRSAFRESG